MVEIVVQVSRCWGLNIIFVPAATMVFPNINSKIQFVQDGTHLDIWWFLKTSPYCYTGLLFCLFFIKINK